MHSTRAARLLLAFVFMFVSLPLLGGTANAQDEELETWEAKSYPITITYNQDLWRGRSSSSFNTNEQVQITARATNFLLQAFQDDDLDEESCLQSYLASIEDVGGVSALEENEDAPLPDGLDGGAEIIVSYDFLWPGREQTVAMIQYLACHEFEPGSFALIGIETRAGIYEEELEIINTLLAGIAFYRQ